MLRIGRTNLTKPLSRLVGGITAIALLNPALPGLSPPAMAQVAADEFEIAYGDTVSDGVPEPGAGNIEDGGATDAYTFSATAGDVAVLDVLAGATVTFRWRLDGPSGATLFDSIYTDRSVELAETGAYTLTVFGATASSAGTYSFRLLLTPPPEEFAISVGDTVSEGVPAAGAGTIEVPGAVDHYRFDATAGQVVNFDVLAGRTTDVRWALSAPDGSEVFDSLYVDREEVLDQTGTYVVSVRGLTVASTGAYSFRLLDVAPPDDFTIAVGDVVSDGVPGPGAGNLEGPGAVDRYRFDATAGEVVIFDVLAGRTTDVRWALSAPDGSEVFDSLFVDREEVLDRSGTYTLTVYGFSVSSFGTYSFGLVDVPPQTDEFTIVFGDTVSDGVPAPGAGNLEGPGAVDRYRFDATAGQVVIFDALAGSTNEVRWALAAPDGSVVFDSLYVDREVILDQSGTYTVTVSGLTVSSFGVYSFQLLEPPPNTAPEAVDDVAVTEFEVAVTVDVLANDRDADGDVLVVDAVTQPSDGTVTFTADDVAYTPDARFFGVDSFTYKVADGRGGFDEATVTVTVNEPPNTPPVVDDVPDQESTVGDAIRLQVVADDPDGDALAYAAAGLPAGLLIDADTGEIAGTIEVGADGSSPYTVEVIVTDPEGAAAATAFQWTVHRASTDTVAVEIDIVAPCIFNNGFGVIPVVVYGNALADGADIDISTVELEGMRVQRLWRWYLGVVGDFDHDGFDDLLVLIDDQAGAIPPEATTATLTGALTDGTTIEGSDDIARCRTWPW